MLSRKLAFNRATPEIALVCAFALAGAITAASFGSGKGGTLRAGRGSDVRGAVQFGQGQKLNSVGSGASAATLWRAPSANGWDCGAVQIGAQVSTPNGNGGVLCTNGSQSIPISLAIAWIPESDGSITAVVSGHARPDVSSVVLQAAGTSQTLAVNGGFFVGEFSAQKAGEIPSGAGAYSVSAYNRGGASLSTLDLRQIVSSATP
jgi:hypothetical protein